MVSKGKAPRRDHVRPASGSAKVAEVATTSYAMRLKTEEPDKSDLVALLRTLTDGLQQRLGSEVQLVMLYGSHARGKAGPGSDVDLFVVLRQGSQAAYDHVRQVAYQAMWDADFVYVFSLYLTDAKHYRALEEHGSSFLRNVQREGMVLWPTT